MLVLSGILIGISFAGIIYVSHQMELERRHVLARLQALEEATGTSPTTATARQHQTNDEIRPVC